MTGFKLRTTGVGSDCSINWATVTALGENFLRAVPYEAIFLSNLTVNDDDACEEK